MKNYILFLASLLFIGISCKSKAEQKTETMQEPTAHKIQVQGHRGERGHLPENTIPAFLGALHKGVDVLELDVVISKDHKVVVSHEPFMSSLYVQTPAGDSISKSEEKSYNLYELLYPNPLPIHI